jgi:hypothetical protein
VAENGNQQHHSGHCHQSASERDAEMKHERHANTDDYGDNQPNIIEMEREPEAEAYATSNQERRWADKEGRGQWLTWRNIGYSMSSSVWYMSLRMSWASS